VALIPVSPEEHEGLRATLADLEGSLRERSALLERTRTDLEAFRIRYQLEVGQLHDQLDELLDAIADAELDIAIELGEADSPPPEADDVADDATAGSEEPRPRPEPASRFTSDAIRKLFRDVAKTIHPDLAHDSGTRDRRHALMVEANRAYAMGDFEKLRQILDAWHGSPDAVTGSGPEVVRERLVRRIAEVAAQLAACEEELASMEETPLWRLKAMVDEAAAAGKDLVADMIRRLEKDILAARNRLEAIRWRP